MRAKASRTWVALIGWLVIGAVVIWLTTILLILYAGSRPVIRKADAILVLGAAQ